MLLTGHLLRVEVHVPVGETIIVFKPEFLEIPGARTPVTAALDWQSKPGPVLLLRHGEEGGGGFTFADYPLPVPKGFRSRWRTR